MFTSVGSVVGVGRGPRRSRGSGRNGKTLAARCFAEEIRKTVVSCMEVLGAGARAQTRRPSWSTCFLHVLLYFFFFFRINIYIYTWYFDKISKVIEKLLEECKEQDTFYPDSLIHFYFCPISFNILYVKCWYIFSGKHHMVIILGSEGRAVSVTTTRSCS